MSLSFTPHAVAAAYEYLRTTPPFKGWKLPHADQVEFAVTRHRDREGDHCTYHHTREHVIRLSSYSIKTTPALLEALAHEMVHAKQDIDGSDTRVDHNRVFQSLAAIVCRRHGFDFSRFVGA